MQWNLVDTGNISARLNVLLENIKKEKFFGNFLICFVDGFELVAGYKTILFSTKSGKIREFKCLNVLNND